MINKLCLAILISGAGLMPQGLDGSVDQSLNLVATVNFDDGVIAPGARVGLLACKARLDQSLVSGDLTDARTQLGLLAAMLGSGGELQYALPGQAVRLVRVESLMMGQKTDQVDLILNQVFNVSFEKLNRYSLERKQSAIDNFVFQAQRMLKFNFPEKHSIKKCSIKKIKALLNRSLFDVPFKIRFLKNLLKVAVVTMVVATFYLIFWSVLGAVFEGVIFGWWDIFLGPVVDGILVSLCFTISPFCMASAWGLAYWEDREDRD